MTRMHEHPPMSSAVVQDLEFATLLSTAGAARRVTPPQPEASAAAPAPRTAERQGVEAPAVAEHLPTTRQSGSKNTYLFDENGKNGVVVPKDAAAQVAWVNSDHNKGKLDARQIARLAPAAQEAYAARRKVEDTTAARAKIDTVLAEGKKGSPTIAERLNGSPEKPATRATTSPEAAELPQQSPTKTSTNRGKKYTNDEQQRLVELAEQAVRTGTFGERGEFGRYADSIGMPRGHQSDLLGEVGARIRAARGEEPRAVQAPAPRRNVMDTADELRAAIGETIRAKTNQYEAAAANSTTPDLSGRSREQQPVTTLPENLLRGGAAQATSPADTETTQRVQIPTQESRPTQAYPDVQSPELENSAELSRQEILEDFYKAIHEGAVGFVSELPDTDLEKIGDRIEALADQLGIPAERVDKILQDAATREEALRSQQAQAQQAAASTENSQAPATEATAESKQEQYDRMVAQAAQGALRFETVDRNGQSTPEGAKLHGEITRLAAELGISESQMAASLRAAAERAAADMNHDQVQAAYDKLYGAGEKKFAPTPEQRQRLEALAAALIIADRTGDNTGDWKKSNELLPHVEQAVNEAGATIEDWRNLQAKVAYRMHQKVVDLADANIALYAQGADNGAFNKSFGEFRALAESYGYSSKDVHDAYQLARQKRIDQNLPVDRPEQKENTANGSQKRPIDSMTQGERNRLFALIDEMIDADVKNGQDSAEFRAKEDALEALYNDLGFDPIEVNAMLWPEVKQARAERGTPNEPPERATKPEGDWHMSDKRLEALQHLLLDKRGVGFRALDPDDMGRVYDELLEAEVALSDDQLNGIAVDRQLLDDIQALRDDAMNLMRKTGNWSRYAQELHGSNRGESRRERRAREAEEQTKLFKEGGANAVIEAARKKETELSWFRNPIQRAFARRARRTAEREFSIPAENLLSPEIVPLPPAISASVRDVVRQAEQVLANPVINGGLKQRIDAIRETLIKDANRYDVGELVGPRSPRTGRRSGLVSALQGLIDQANSSDEVRRSNARASKRIRTPDKEQEAIDEYIYGLEYRRRNPGYRG